MAWLADIWTWLILIGGLVCVAIGGKAFGAFAVLIGVVLFTDTSIELGRALSTDWHAYTTQIRAVTFGGEKALIIGVGKLLAGALMALLGVRQWYIAGKKGADAA
jgi:hypothetical protein